MADAINAPAPAATNAPAPAAGNDQFAALVAELQKVPEVQALLSGQARAISAPADMFGENVQQVYGAILDGFPAVTGKGATIGPKSFSLVLFDPAQVTEQQIEEADNADQLHTLATPVSTGEQVAPAPAPEAPAATAAAGLTGKVPTTPAALQAARAANVAPLPPSRQKSPGAGQIVNDLLKRPI